MRKSETHTAVSNSVEHSNGMRNDPASRRARIAARARNNPKEQFNNLVHHLTYEQIEECLSKIPSSSATGVDGMTVKDARKHLNWLLPPLLNQIHKGKYEAPPVRRVYIPKMDGKQRLIGVPEIIDRSIQAGASKLLSEIYEQDFLNCSFGFRPKLGCHHALATISELLRSWKMTYALEVDIRDFFGSLDHDWLRKFLGLRISDKRMLKLIDAWLKAGVMEKGKWQETETGTPQGGSVSPILANVYLHYVLDLWFEKKIKKQLRGKARLVRYCDDLVILFQDQQDVEEVQTLLRARLAQFGLTMAEEKTHKTDLTPRTNQGNQTRRRITFLGFNILRIKNRKGTGSKTVFQTEGKRFTRAKAAMKQKLFRIMHMKVDKQVAIINSLLIGHFNYYGMAGNSWRIANFWHFTKRYWRRCLSARSQNGAVNWEELKQIAEKYKLCNPRLRITYQELSSYVRL